MAMPSVISTSDAVRAGRKPVRALRQCLTIFSAFALALGLSTTLAQPAFAAYNPGRVCNYSSVPIWLTVQPIGQPWSAAQFGSGQCTSFGLQDVEAVWGKRCDPTCRLISWKVPGYSTTTVTNGYISPVPPGRVLFRSGDGSWYTASEWPRPSLSHVNYDLR
jgi:hypothetical protein